MGVNLKIGSTGSKVERMQEGLMGAGYDVGSAGADGVFGPDTESALKQFQKDQGAKIDGIFGPESSGLLYGKNQIVGVDNAGNVGITIPSKTDKGSGGGTGGGNTGGGTVEGTDGGNTGGTTDATGTGIPNVEVPNIGGFGYTDPTVVQDAYNAIAALSAPTYSSQWQAQIKEYLGKIMNREEFSYDFNNDALYQQYKDIYTQMGLMSMMDTMGQAAAMTGGYGNSYAQTVGQQAYNQQLSQLNDVLPELYQMAFDRYAYEGEQLYNQYGLLMDQENLDYSRYMDKYNQYLAERDYRTGVYNNERNFAYNQQWDEYTSNYNQAWDTYNATYGQEWDEYNANYQEGRDAVDDQQTNYDKLATMINKYGYEPSDEELAAAGMTRGEYEALKKAYDSASNGAATGNSSSGTGTEAKTYTTLTHEDRQLMQKEIDHCETFEELKDLAKLYAAQGYDPDLIETMLRRKLKEFEDAGIIDTTVVTGIGGSKGTGVGVGGPNSFMTMMIQ